MIALARPTGDDLAQIRKSDPDSADVDLSQWEHISPIEWENLLLYG